MIVLNNQVLYCFNTKIVDLVFATCLTFYGRKKYVYIYIKSHSIHKSFFSGLAIHKIT